MLKDKTDVSPIISAQNLTPLWMTKIKDFDGLEIQPCHIIGRTELGRDIVEPCQPHQAEFWTVYGHYRPTGSHGGVEAFEDFKTKAEAQKFHDRLLAVYPHLAGDRSSAPKQTLQRLTP